MKGIVVFSGSAHHALADEICDHLEVPRSHVKISRFSNDCLQAQLLANCRQRDVYIVQPLVPPTQEHLMELLLMVNTARGASAAQITAVIPHYAYARSDKKDASRISLGGRLVADLLVTGPGTELIMLGGHVNREYMSVQGATTTAEIANLQIDVAVLGCSGIGERAVVRDTDPRGREIKLTARRQASILGIMPESSSGMSASRASTPMREMSELLSGQSE